jgi:segregation and condensation protein A
VRSYLQAMRRRAGSSRYRPRSFSLWSVKDALQRLAHLLHSLPDWASLEQFLPDTMGDPLERRAALASTLVASLEMARDGMARLRQEHEFGPILVRRAPGQSIGDRVEEGA